MTSRSRTPVARRRLTTATALLTLLGFSTRVAAQATAAPPAEPPAPAPAAPAAEPPVAPAAEPPVAPAAAPAVGPAAPAPPQGQAWPAPPYGYASQPAPYAPVPIALHADEPGRIVELYHPRQKPEEDVPLIRCVTPCMAQVTPGKYRVHVHATDDTRAGSRIVSLGGPSYVTVTPDGYGPRWVGLGLGIGGLALLQVGIVLLVLDLGNSVDRIDCNDGIDGSCPDNVDYAYPGLLALLGGLVITPIGWVIFGKSFSPTVDVDPARVRRAGRRQVPLVVGSGPDGSAGLSIGARF